MFSKSFSYSSTAIRLATVTIAIAIILAASNFTSGIAQQQNQSATNQASVLRNSASATATTAAATISSTMSTEDSFKVQTPSGWIVQDVKNSGYTLASEVLQGYGLLAQLCPAQQDVQQQ